MNTALPGSWPGLAAMDCDFSKAHVPLCTRPRPPPPPPSFPRSSHTGLSPTSLDLDL